MGIADLKSMHTSGETQSRMQIHAARRFSQGLIRPGSMLLCKRRLTLKRMVETWVRPLAAATRIVCWLHL